MKTRTPDNISSSVMDQIKSGKVHMKPRAYYVALSIASLGAVVLAGITLAYLSSIMFFWVRIQTADTMAWGARANLSESIASFPWWAALLSLALIIVAVVLVRRHGRMYQHKTSTIAAVLVVGSLLLGLGLSLLDIGAPHTPSQPGANGRGPGQGQNIRQNAD